MKAIKRKRISLLVVSALVLSFALPSISVYAEDANNQSLVSNTTITELDNVMASIDNLKLQKDAEDMGIIDENGDIAITDSQMAQLLESQNLPVPTELKSESSKNLLKSSKGVTKVVKKNGYTYIYLSTTTAHVVSIGSVAAAGILATLTGGLAAGIAIIIVGAVSEMSWAYMSGGIWLKFKGAKLVGKGKQ